MQDLASEFLKNFLGVIPGPSQQEEATPSRTQHLARPLAKCGAQTPQSWDPNLGPSQLFSCGCAPGVYLVKFLYENHVKVKVIGVKKCDIPYTLYVCLSAIGLKYLHCKTLMGNNFGSVEKRAVKLYAAWAFQLWQIKLCVGHCHVTGSDCT